MNQLIKTTMEKKIEDYLHLYLGCQCIQEGLLHPATFNIDRLNRSLLEPQKFKLLLRPLSDITEEELGEWAKITGNIPDEKELKTQHESLIILLKQKGINAFVVNEGEFHLVPKLLVFILSKGFDIFDLIPAGLAIDKTKLHE